LGDGARGKYEALMERLKKGKKNVGLPGITVRANKSKEQENQSKSKQSKIWLGR